MLRLTLEREKRGWNKTQLAFEARLHPSIIGQLEAGKLYAYPAYKKRLASVFGIPAEMLFEEVNADERSCKTNV